MEMQIKYLIDSNTALPPAHYISEALIELI